MAKNVLSRLGRALENVANVGSTFASRSTIAALSSLPEVIKCYHTGKGYTLANLYYLCYINGTNNSQIVPICTAREYWFRADIRKKINDVKRCNNSIIETKVLMTFFKDKNYKSQKK